MENPTQIVFSLPWTGGLRRRGAAVERAYRPLWEEAPVHAREHPLVNELVRSVPAHDLRQLDVYIRGLSLGRGLPVAGDMSMISAIHSDGTPWAGAATHDGVAIDRSIANKHAQYPELVVSQTVEFLVLACEEGGRWGPDAASCAIWSRSKLSRSIHFSGGLVR